MRILGIDPGSSRMGYGCIEKIKEYRIRAAGSTDSKRPTAAERLVELGATLEEVIRTTKPHGAVVEKLFFAKNKKTALGVAEARGVVLFLLARHHIPILEMTPNEMKRAITGDGAAHKEGVRKLTALTLGVGVIGGRDDVSDALALALAGILLS